MNVLGATTEFKKDHPHNYWLRILCLAFCMVFLTLWITGDVEGAATVESDYNQSTTYSNPNFMFASSEYSHTKDNILMVPYCDSTGNLNIAWKLLIDDDWNYTEVAPFDYDSLNGPWYIYGSVNTDNGSVVIGAVNSNSGTALDRVYLWTKFLGADWDDWDPELIISSSTNYYGHIAINDTDTICLLFKRGASSPYGTYYETFDFESYSLGHAVGQGHSWGEASKQVAALVTNVTGKFHFFWQDNANIYQYRDLEKVIAKRSIPVYIKDAVCLPNDMFVLVGAATNTVTYMYQTTWGGAFTSMTVSVGSGKAYNYNAVLCIIDNSTTVRIVAYDGTDDVMRTWTAGWDASPLTWQNSQATTSVARPGGYIRIIGGQSSYWPRDEDGRSWSLPTLGWSYQTWDEIGSPDEYGIFANGILWYGDLTIPPPELTTISLPNAVFGELYEASLTKANGTAPFNWTILIGPSWLNIGDVNGTLWGIPDATGTQQVRVKLSDCIPRTDEKQWTLTIGAASSGEGEGPWAGIWGDMWLDAGNCSSAGVLLLIILFAIGTLAIVGSWKS